MMMTFVKTVTVIALLIAVFDRAMDVLAEPATESMKTENLQRQIYANEQKEKFLEAYGDLKIRGMVE